MAIKCLLLVLIAIFIPCGSVDRLTRDEIIAIKNCVSDLSAANTTVCKEFVNCQEQQAEYVYNITMDCEIKFLGETPQCREGETLYESRNKSGEIYDCIAEGTPENTPEEEAGMVRFENCLRMINSTYFNSTYCTVQ